MSMGLDELFTPKVKHRPWMDEKIFILGTVANLAQIIDDCIASGRYGIDSETSGLDNRVYVLNGEYRTYDRIAGICLSPDGITGYYIPLHHALENPDGTRSELECNIPIQTFDREFRRLIKATEECRTVAVFHNATFDQEFFQFNETGQPWGDWDKPSSWDCTLILTYLGDSRKRDKRLKTLSEEILGIEQVHLEELFPTGHQGKMDFTTLDPTDIGTLWYACGDAICTRLLYDTQSPAVLQPDSDGKTQKTVYMIEKGCVSANRWMQRNRVHVDPKKVAELITLGHQEWLDAILDVYIEAEKVLHRDVMPSVYRVLKDRFEVNDPLNTLHDQIERAAILARGQFPEDPGHIKGRDSRDWPCVYDVNSPQQLGVMFDEMDIPGLRKTDKSGQIKTSKDELERIVEEAGDQFPFMRKIKRFREVNKALSTYLYPMAQDCDPIDHTMRINFNAHKVDTGRYATPAKEDEKKRKERMIGWPEVNFQAIPSMAFDPKKPRPECMRRMRECINVRSKPDGRKRFVVAADFSGEELRLITNLSREPKWLNEFFHCSSCDRTFDRGDGEQTPEPPPPRCPNCDSDKIGDLHTLTGIAIYGSDAPKESNWKVLRGNSKAVNFSLSYGGGGSAVVRALKNDIDKNEGWRIKNQFDKTYDTLASWWKRQHIFAEKHAFVRTAFGRKYPLPDIRSEERMFVEKAKRNAVNGPVQGCMFFGARIPTCGGYLEVQELCDKTFQVWTGRAWVSARAFSSGEKVLTETNLSSGRQIKTSPDHKFLKYFGRKAVWVAQGDLKIKDWIATNAQTIPFEEPRYKYNKSPGHYQHNSKGFSIDGNSDVLWEFLGMLYGDGSINLGSLRVHCGDTDDFPEFSAEHYAKAWVSKLNSSLNIGALAYCQQRQEGDTRHPIWKIEVYNKAFRVFCRDILGVLDQNTYTKRFPRAVWSESEKNRAAFLKGYFSSDGTVSPTHKGKDAGGFSVRSTNEGLLRDTQALLGTLGIRSSCRLKSKRVTVQDRERFRQIVGYNVAYKKDRMTNVELGFYANQRYAIPPDLIRWVGEVIYKSSIYAKLPRNYKSAVLRLVAGSGSKSQCLTYLQQIPKNEIPSELTEAFEYDYEQVTKTENLGTLVPMYDIEVFDSCHAFVCDGVIVHNSGGDIIKIAMALIYKECKKRGWLEKCQMVATMHDELVFEIDGDIIEEAVKLLVGIMTRNTFILAQKWPVPLTTDVELGYDWSVPWDINAMRAKEYRFIGNKKIKKPEDTPEGYDWNTLPCWPADLQPFFQEAGGSGIVHQELTPPPVSVMAEPVSSTSESTVEPAADPGAIGAVSATQIEERKKMSETMASGVYEFQLQTGLRLEIIPILAEVIKLCRDSGTCALILKARDGSILDEWTDKTIKVNPLKFEAYAKAHGLT